MQQLLQRVERQEQQIKTQEELLKLQENQLQVQFEKAEQQIKNTGQTCAEILEKVAGQQIDFLQQLKEQQMSIQKDVKATRNHAWQGQKNSEEIIWAEIFNNAISDSKWLTNKSFSAGRWAVGYQYLYVVYRILNEVHPKQILELGLGQSTRLLGQYAASDEAVQHTVVEHDSTWIQFFQQDFQLSENSKIVQLEREYKTFLEDEHVLTFKNFKETFSGKKFDFISIDAPLGAEAIVYARVDILDLLPECLAESFVIVVDDYNRQGEKNTVAVLEDILQKNEIIYTKGVYSGKKDCIVICSEDLKFVCSM